MTQMSKSILQPGTRPALSKRLREQLKRRQRQEERDLLRRYDDRQVDDREPPPRWM